MTRQVEEFLAHYASQYYDPVKAHEYYMKNRELKGTSGPARIETKGLKGQARADAVAANRQASEAYRQSQQRKSEAVAYTRKQISEARKADLTNTADAHKENLAKLKDSADATVASIQSKLDELKNTITKSELKIPANASPKLRAFLEKQQRSRTQRAQAEAAKKVRQVGLDLRDAVKKAREEYATKMDSLRTQYTDTMKSEIANVKQNVN